MSTQRFTPEFKAEAVRQVIERGYSVAEIAARLGVSTHSLYKWVTEGIDRYLIRSTCLGVDACTGKLYSTHGLSDLLNNCLKMNELNPRPDLFRAKAASYRARWPWLQLVE